MTSWRREKLCKAVRADFASRLGHPYIFKTDPEKFTLGGLIFLHFPDPLRRASWQFARSTIFLAIPLMVRRRRQVLARLGRDRPLGFVRHFHLVRKVQFFMNA